MAIDALSFLQYFEGRQPEVPRAELRYVAQQFRSLVDDILLNQIGSVRTRSSNGAASVNGYIELDDRRIDMIAEAGSFRPIESSVYGGNPI